MQGFNYLNQKIALRHKRFFMKLLFANLAFLLSFSSFACDGLVGKKLEKRLLEELKLDLQSLSYGTGNSGPMLRVKKASISSFIFISETVVGFPVKLYRCA